MRKIGIFLTILVCSFVLSGCTFFDSKVKAGLQVVTNDVKASLFLNDQYLDKTPYINKSIKPGTYSLKIEPEDKSLAPLETSITLNQGTLTVVTWNPGKTPETSGGVTYELQPYQDAKKAEVDFRTVPDTAIVTFDNREQTFSPLSITDVEPGNHEFEVKLPSYQTQKHTMNAVAGKKLIVTIKLAKQTDSQTKPASETTDTATDSSRSTTATDAASATSTSANLSPAALTSEVNKNLTSATPATDSVNTGPRVKILPTSFLISQREVLRVRASADTTSQEVGLVTVGQEYRYLGDHTNGFYHIQFGNQQTGWVSDKFAQVVTP